MLKQQLVINHYYGNTYIRLYDTELKKNVAKIETGYLMNLLNEKIVKGEYEIAEKKKGNSLPVLTFK